MKKSIITFIAMILALTMLMGCSSNKLSEDFDEDTLKSSAEEIVDLINNDDFETMINDKSSDEVKEAITVEQMKEAKLKVMKNAGEFQSFESETVLGDELNEEDVAVVIIIAQYENQKVQFTIGYNKDMQMNQIYMK